MLIRFLAVAGLVLVVGCADRSADVAASYVSPLQYQAYDCNQLAQEANRVTARASQLSGIQDKNANNDAVATGVALVVFWPAAFFIGGNKETKAELARLKGELEAIEAASIGRNCRIKFR